jgi:hypothetical protein
MTEFQMYKISKCELYLSNVYKFNKYLTSDLLYLHYKDKFVNAA